MVVIILLQAIPRSHSSCPSSYSPRASQLGSEPGLLTLRPEPYALPQSPTFPCLEMPLLTPHLPPSAPTPILGTLFWGSEGGVLVRASFG